MLVCVLLTHDCQQTPVKSQGIFR